MDTNDNYGCWTVSLQLDALYDEVASLMNNPAPNNEGHWVVEDHISILDAIATNNSEKQNNQKAIR